MKTPSGLIRWLGAAIALISAMAGCTRSDTGDEPVGSHSAPVVGRGDVARCSEFGDARSCRRPCSIFTKKGKSSSSSSSRSSASSSDDPGAGVDRIEMAATFWKGSQSKVHWVSVRYGAEGLLLDDRSPSLGPSRARRRRPVG